MASFVRISVLSWADLFAGYAMWLMMTYLTNVWKLSSTHAADILNIWNGIAKIFPIVFALFVDSIGHYSLLLISSIAYCIGLGFLTMSTPPVLGSCSDYKPECIGHTQKSLFYTALALIAVGTSGHLVSFESFQEDQKDTEDDKKEFGKEKENKNKDLWQTLGLLAVLVVSVAGGIALPYIRPWKLRFGIPAICTLIATIMFTTGQCTKSYKMLRPNVGSFKVGLQMVPVWITFIMCGLVLSIGNTYFLDQANTMSRKLGRIKVPISILLLFYNFVKTFFSAMYLSSATRRTSTTDSPPPRKYGPPIGIGIAMTFSVLSCITAAKVETSRLHVIRDHGLLDKPDEIVPMTIFKLFPQFLLLAAFDGIFEKSVADFFIGQNLPSTSNYLTNGVSGLGTIGSVLSVHIVGKVSERGGRQSWFQKTLSKSRLDRYYWTLAALSAVNLIVYSFVASCYTYKDVPAQQTEAAAPGKGGSAEQNQDEDA